MGTRSSFAGGTSRNTYSGSSPEITRSSGYFLPRELDRGTGRARRITVCLSGLGSQDGEPAQEREDQGWSGQSSGTGQETRPA